MVINQSMRGLEKHQILCPEVMQLAVRVKQLLFHLVVVGLIELKSKTHIDGRTTHGGSQQLRCGVAQQCYLDAWQVMMLLLNESFELFQVEHSSEF